MRTGKIHYLLLLLMTSSLQRRIRWLEGSTLPASPASVAIHHTRLQFARSILYTAQTSSEVRLPFTTAIKYCIRLDETKLENISSRIDMRTYAGCTWYPCDLPFDLRMPRSSYGCLPTLVLISQAVFLSKRGQTDKQTNKETDAT